MAAATSSHIGLVPSLSREFLLHHRCCPIDRTGDGIIIVAVVPDATQGALDDIAVAYQSAVFPRDVSSEELERLIERTASRSDREIQLERGTDLQDDTTTDVRDLAQHPPRRPLRQPPRPRARAPA
jgi:hypothetical protein